MELRRSEGGLRGIDRTDLGWSEGKAVNQESQEKGRFKVGRGGGT